MSPQEPKDPSVAFPSKKKKIKAKDILRTARKSLILGEILRPFGERDQSETQNSRKTDKKRTY